MTEIRYAHQTPENGLCTRVVYVCPYCGWWKAERFECRHMVEAVDGKPAFRDYSAQRCGFHLDGQCGGSV